MERSTLGALLFFAISLFAPLTPLQLKARAAAKAKKKGQQRAKGKRKAF
jgi:hypothetical protein